MLLGTIYFCVAMFLAGFASAMLAAIFSVADQETFQGGCVFFFLVVYIVVSIKSRKEVFITK